MALRTGNHGHTARAYKARGTRGKWLAPVLAITLLSFAIRIHHLDADSLWFDEASTARNLVVPLETVIEEASLGHLPYVILLRALPQLEANEFGLRYPSVLFGAFGVAAISAVGRRLGGEPTGALAALMLMLSPMHVWYSREARTYASTVAAVLLAVLAFVVHWQRRCRSTWIRVALSQAAAAYAHLFAALTSAWLTVFVLAAAWRRRLPWRIRSWVVAQLAVFAAVAPMIGILVWGAGQKSQLPWVGVPNLFTLADLSMHLAGVKYLQEHSWSWVIWILWLGLMAWAIWQAGGHHLQVRGLDTAPFDTRLFLVAWATVPIAVLFLVSWIARPVYVHRYVVMSLPAYLLIISTAAVSKRHRLMLLPVLVLLASSVVGTSDLLSSPVYSKPDWRTLQGQLATSLVSRDSVLFHPWLLKRPFDYYNSRGGPVIKAQMATTSRLPGAETSAEDLFTAETGQFVDRAAANGSRLVVVERDIDMRASHWLRSSGGWRLEDEVTFLGGLRACFLVRERAY